MSSSSTGAGGGGGQSGGAVSPKIFPSAASPFDDVPLCFNKAHFSRSDFNVERFMNLARRRATLKDIHSDLRVYLKSIQNSMIELINDDYADFVNLSSNLVSLKGTIDKIDGDIENIWSEFRASTKEAVDTAEQIETRCDALSRNRVAQEKLRSQIVLLSALQQLNTQIQQVPSPVNVLWLEKISSLVVDATGFADELAENSKEAEAYRKVMCSLSSVLGRECVLSLKGNCQQLPLMLSLLSLCGQTDGLVARVVSEVVEEAVSTDSPRKARDLHALLQHTLQGVGELRCVWSSKLGARFSGGAEAFLDQALLTHVLVFLDKSLATVIVPSDTRLFHRCYSAVCAFIEGWPARKKARRELKAIRDKFNLVVYSKLVTHPLQKAIDAATDPERVETRGKEERDKDDDCLLPSARCTATVAVAAAIKAAWSDEVYLPTLADKMWDFTLRSLTRYLGWVRGVLDHACSSPSPSSWRVLLCVRGDASELAQAVFDHALETVWGKLRCVGVDTQPFGQTLTRYTALVEEEMRRADERVADSIAHAVKKELEGVADVPKQYRWTKKPVPTTHSPYIDAAHKVCDEVVSWCASEGHSAVCEAAMPAILTHAYQHFATKADQVLESVEATGSSLSRLKKRTGGAGGMDGDSDETKIRVQILHDVVACRSRAEAAGVEMTQLEALCKRASEDKEGAGAGAAPPASGVAVREGSA